MSDQPQSYEKTQHPKFVAIASHQQNGNHILVAVDVFGRCWQLADDPRDMAMECAWPYSKLWQRFDAPALEEIR